MAYVAVKGGQKAIEASLKESFYQRVAAADTPDVQTIENAMGALIDQVMSESSLYNPTLAALAIKQAQGSPEEAVFLLRAFRSTLPRKHYSLTVDTRSMQVERRISAAFKDIPGGQMLGRSADYSHRLLNFELMKEASNEMQEWINAYLSEAQKGVSIQKYPKVADYIKKEGLLRTKRSSETQPCDVTKRSLQFPSKRSERLQILSRGQTGAVTALGYAALRGYGVLHPTVGELRVGNVAIEVPNPLSPIDGDPMDIEDDSYYIGDITITEVESLIPVSVPKGQGKSDLVFELGYGVCFGQNETKAIAMSILDQSLESENKQYPTQDEEFVLLHIDSVEATGFISHLKLPHYVTFQSKLDALRKKGKGIENEK